MVIEAGSCNQKSNYHTHLITAYAGDLTSHPDKRGKAITGFVIYTQKEHLFYFYCFVSFFSHMRSRLYDYVIFYTSSCAQDEV